MIVQEVIVQATQESTEYAEKGVMLLLVILAAILVGWLIRVIRGGR